jgi:DNA polymerase-3 subunit delta
MARSTSKTTTPGVSPPAAPGSRPPAYAIFGKEEFLKRRALSGLMDRLLGPHRESLAVAEFEGGACTLAEVLDECRTASLLAPTRVVCVREADEFVSAHREALERYLKAPSTTGVLILVCQTWDKKTRLYKLVESLGGNIACETPDPRALPGWLAQHAKSTYACTLPPDAARRLADLTGPALGQLDMELGKLATYIAPRTVIAVEDVDQLVGATRVELVFRITDAIAARDAKRALEVWDQIISGEKGGQYRAIGGLAYGLRRLAEAKRLMAKGLPAAEAARRAGIFQPPEVLRRQLERFSLAQWRGHLVKLLRIDAGSKRGLGTPQALVERLIVELAAAS